jgi:hypothetical protein
MAATQVRNSDYRGRILRAVYLCQHCQQSVRHFYILFDKDGEWIMKVGQYPAWSTKPDSEIEKLLGEHAGYFKKGLVCESQSYGIGAFGYYRRIVEEIIDQLLEEIGGLVAGEEQQKYRQAFERTKRTTVAQDKIDLVKDLLPAILRPEGMNPLAVLHQALSEGLHASSDEICLQKAAIIREVLVYMVNQVAARKAAGASFTDGMRKLLEQKAAKGKNPTPG